MNAEKRKALEEAVTALIEDSDAPTIFAALEGVLALVRKGIPVFLTERPAVLNPLVALATDDFPAYERVLDLIERKRSERNLPPLVSEDDARRAYMRDFMAVKRDRQRRLVELWNSLRSEHDRIRGTARMEFERRHAARWIDEKNRRETARRETLGRRLTADERRELTEQLWRDVDYELDSLEEFVRDEMRKPIHARSKSGFTFIVGKI